jgi:hypothetical protein
MFSRTKSFIDTPSWFNVIFGFNEVDYESTKKKLEYLYNGSQINNINVGTFTILSNKELKSKLNNKIIHSGIGHVIIKNIIGDITEIHKDIKNKNSLIQVASQFNCLEMKDPNITPENGITIYEHDYSQGPKCAIATPAALAYRNYLYNKLELNSDDIQNASNSSDQIPHRRQINHTNMSSLYIGQTKDKQINMANDLLNYLKKFDNSINWNMQNGYLLFDDINSLQKINQLLNNNDIFQFAKNIIKVGYHSDIGVCIDNIKYHNLNHVYCSGLPISYHNHLFQNKDIWVNISKLFLEGQYENTLMLACLNNLINDKPVYLTMIGGGVFGMDHYLIKDAIKKSCVMIENMGYNLEVNIVHYREINPIYLDLS